MSKWFCLAAMCFVGLFARGEDVMTVEGMPRYGQWRSSMLGGGGWIQNVVFTGDAKRLYAYVDVGGFYRSDDGGKTWRMMHGHLPNRTGQNEVRAVSVDPRKADRILVACGNAGAEEQLGLFLSEDGGETFVQVLKERFAGNAEFRWTGFVLARDPGDAARVLAGSFGDGMYRSENGGRTWTLAGENTRGVDFTDVKFGRDDPSKAWACAKKLENTVGGKTRMMEGGLFASRDGGKSWRKISEEEPEEMARDGNRRLIGLFEGGTRVKASADGGVTWKEFGEGLEIDAQKAGGNGAPSAYRYYAIGEGEGFLVVASARGDFYRLADGESKWKKVERAGVDYRGWVMTERPDVQPMFGQMVSSVSVDPRDANHWFNTDAFGLYETRDGGKHWGARLDGVEATVIHTLCQDPGDAARVHMGMGDCGYFRSEDGGASFGLSFVCSNVKDVAVSGKLPARVYAVGTGAWEWASNQVFVSIDGGKSWSRSPMIGLPDMSHARCNTIAVNPEDPYECFVAVSGEGRKGGGPYRSTDGGKSWKWIGEGLPLGVRMFPESIWMPGRQMAAGMGGEVACVSGGWVYRLDRKTMEWKGTAVKGAGTAIVADPFAPGVWIVSGDGGICRMEGESVSKVREGKATHVAADGKVRGRFAAAVEEGIVVSVDGGKSWQLMDEKLPSRLGYNAIAFAGERLVAGSGGSGVFWIPLSEAGERPVKAHAVVAAPAKAGKGQVPVLKNLDFSQGEGYPAAWGQAWSGEGKVEVARDAKVLVKGKASLRLETKSAGSMGTVSQDFAATFDEFGVSGAIRVEGKVEAGVAVQVYDGSGKQIAWISVTNVKETSGEKEFSGKVTLPKEARRAVLVLIVHGDGKAWYGDLRVTGEAAVFR